ncbi:hypothetical protein [Mesorhizobium sp. KR1-2]|uniref:hypothetical protein n=1 Tax=Mesorhizobium sp. KR1-2 TaxID=3156609 RepID=UPI0032B4763A
MQHTRLMPGGRVDVVDGHLVMMDQHGVIYWTTNKADRYDPHAPFDVNGVRLAGIQRLIRHRYGGPCDCDGDVHLYLSAAFNAIALGLQLKRRKATPGHFTKWAKKWCPSADPDEVMNLAERVIARPRRIKASTLGKLLGLSSAEHSVLKIEAIYPADDETFESRRKREKADRDREAKARKRRDEGCQPLAAIVDNSEKEFCRRHRISDRTLRYHKSKGPEALAKFLAKKGIAEKLPQDGASIDEVYPLMKRQGAASFADKDGGGRKASQPAPSGLVIDFNITDTQFERLLDEAEADRRQAASRAAAASVSRKALLYDAAIRVLSRSSKAA